METNKYEHRARERKAADIWEHLRPGCLDFDPTNDEIVRAAKELGFGDPSTATCDRVRRLAAQSAVVDARSVDDILGGYDK